MKQKLAIGAGVIVAGSLLTANIIVLSKLNRVEYKIERSQDAIENINKRVETIEDKVILQNTGVKLTLSDRERDCLQRNVFYEAGVESHEGKIAVAQVTLNRFVDSRYDDICKVVYARKQFSWTLDRKKRQEKPKGELWEASKKATRDFVNGVRVAGLDRVKHYHTNYIQQPYWAREKKIVAQIGQHIFYEH